MPNPSVSPTGIPEPQQVNSPGAATGNVSTPSGAIVNATSGALINGPTSPGSSVSAPSPITPSDLNSSNLVANFKPTPPSPIYNTSSINPAAPYQSLTPEQQQAQGESTQLQDLNRQLSEQAQYRIDLTKQAGYGISQDANGQLTINDPSTIELQTQLTQLQNEAKQIPQQVMGEFAGGTKGAVDAQQTAQLRQNAIQTLQLSSQIAAKQGLLSLATQQINNAVYQKYGPIQQEISTLKDNLDALQKSPEYTNAEKTQAADAATALAQQSSAIQAEASQWKDAQSLAAQYAAVPGVSNAVLTQMRDATDPVEVQAIANQHGIILPSTLSSITQTRLQQGELAQQPINLALKMAQLKQANAIASAYTNSNFLQGVSNGTIPIDNINSRTAPIFSALANYNSNTGNNVNFTQLGTNEKAASAVITGLQKQSAQITQAGKALESNMKLLASLSDKVNGLGIPKVATIKNSLISQYSNQPDVVKYLNTLNLVRSEYAKYASRGGQVDDTVRAEANAAIPAGVNGATLQQLYNTLKTEGTNVQQSIKDAQSGAWENVTSSAAPINTPNQTPSIRVIPSSQIPAGMFQASDGKLYKK